MMAVEVGQNCVHRHAELEWSKDRSGTAESSSYNASKTAAPFVGATYAAPLLHQHST